MFIVDKIVGIRQTKSGKQCLLRWEAYGSDDDTWEDEEQWMADYITDFQTNYTASSVLYEGDPGLEKINNIIDCRKGRSGLEFLIDWETGPQTWEVEANVSTDVVKEYMILNSRCRSYIKSDQYNSTKKKAIVINNSPTIGFVLPLLQATSKTQLSLF